MPSDSAALPRFQLQVALPSTGSARTRQRQGGVHSVGWPVLRCASDPQDLHLVGEGDRYPLRMARRPLELVDLFLRCVGQDRVLHGLWHRRRHRRQIPDERLTVVAPGIMVAAAAAAATWWLGRGLTRHVTAKTLSIRSFMFPCGAI